MRVLSVNHTSDLYGSSRCLERVASRLLADGVGLVVVLPKAGSLRDALEREGATVVLHPSLPVIDRSSMQTFRGKLQFAISLPMSVLFLAWIIVRHNIDLVHSNSAVIISPSIAAKVTGRSHVWHIREFFFEFRSLWKRYERIIYALSTRIVAISFAVKEQFSSDLRSKIEVVYDGLPRQSFASAAVRSESERFKERFGLVDRPTAGVVGRLKWVRKGQEVFVRAAALNRDKYPRARYVIVGTAAPGNEEHAERLHKLVDDLGLRENVVFTGDIDDVRPVFAALDVSVAPPVDPEPFGCIVAESMAMGTPVVGSNAAGIAEQIIDGKSGILFPPGSEVALAEALDQLFSKPELRASMSKTGVEVFLDRFEMQRCYEEYLRVFRSAVSNQRQTNRGNQSSAIAGQEERATDVAD